MRYKAIKQYTRGRLSEKNSRSRFLWLVYCSEFCG